MAQSPSKHKTQLHGSSADTLVEGVRRLTRTLHAVTTSQGNGVLFLNEPAIGPTSLEYMDGVQLGPVTLYNIYCAETHLCGYLFVSSLHCNASVFHATFIKKRTSAMRDILMNPTFVEKRLVLENIVVYSHNQGILLAVNGANVITDMLSQ